jgi:long-chain acyl-CoA synthetase
MAQPVFRTIPELFLHRVQSTPEARAFLHPAGDSWTAVTWREVGERVRAVACGLRALGLRGEERCSLLAGTRLEWILADLGTLCAGGATTTIYPSTTAEECAYIIKDSGSIFVFADNEEQVRKLSARRTELRAVKNVIVFDGFPGPDGWVISLAQFMERGRATDSQQPGAYQQIARSVQGQSLATLIYTSGTTGRPKGVELTHDCWIYESEAIDALGILRQDDIQYLWLPLAHVFGKVLEVAQLRIGFLTAIDGRVDRLVENLAAIRPTFVAAVPRIFEKVYNRVVGGAKEAGGAKYALFKWAFGVGSQVSRLRQAGKGPGPLLALKNAVATGLVFSKLRARFGGRLRFFVSGSAPLGRTVGEFFDAANITVLEGYGLTESSAATCVNLPGRNRVGTVGPPLPGTELKIAQDGEILIRGRGVMRGYHGLPDLTQEALDPEGWLHTGDIGNIEDGFLRITDRKKDLFKTSTGKYIAPSDLENRLKVACPQVGQVLVHGANRNFISALIALDPETLKTWAQANGQAERSYAELASSLEMHAVVERCVTELNGQLPNYATIKRFLILPQDLTIESGDLTPSLKLKRQAVERKYRQLLDDLYKAAMAQL